MLGHGNRSLIGMMWQRWMTALSTMGLCAIATEQNHCAVGQKTAHQPQLKPRKNMVKLNLDLPYADICGTDPELPGARYEQGGRIFSASRECIFVSIGGELVPYDGKDYEKVVVADTSLDEAALVIADLQKRVDEAKDALEAAREGDTNLADTTGNIADAQQVLTIAQSALTKATNEAAVKEAAAAKAAAKAAKGK
jgi:hypothetical protein